MLHRVRFSTILPCTQERAYLFHCDTNNLPRITPPWIDVKIAALQLPLHVKSQIDLSIKRMGMTQRWLMEIAVMEKPLRVVDRALASPFKSFRHEHRFEKIDADHTFMVDTIDFELPLWPLSWIVLPWIKKDLEKMFKFRHEATYDLMKK